MEQLKKWKGYWVFLIAAAICWTLVSRAGADIYSVAYGGDQFQTRWLTGYDLDSTQPQVYVREDQGLVMAHVLRDVSALSLKAGTYDIELTYQGTDTSSVLMIFSSDYTSPDNSGGRIFLCETLDTGQAHFAAELEIDQDVNSVYLLVETADPAFSVESLHLASREPVCSDTAYYCVLTLLAAIAFFALRNGRFVRIAPGALGEETVPSDRVALCSVLIGAAAVFVAALPLVRSGLIQGHDLPYHLARIDGLAAGLKSGQFPVRVHGETLNGFGYPNSCFYPELLLYFPAALCLLGVHTITAYKFYLVLLHVLTVILSYIPFKRITHSRSLALTLSVVYLLNPYRLICAYYRAAIGEFAAMTFLPLVLYGLYAILLGEPRDWPCLVAGATGLIQSHILTTELAAFLCFILMLAFIRQLFTKERRILSLITAGVYTVLLNVWFIVPMLAATITIRPQLFDRVQNPYHFTRYDIGHLFATVSLHALGPHMTGWVPLFATALYLVHRAAFPGRKRRGAGLRFADILAVVCVVGPIATTAYFPWDSLARIPFLGSLLDVIQFPYRLMSLAGVSASILAGYTVLLWLKEQRHRTAACVCMVCLSVLTACLMNEFDFLNASGFGSKHEYINNLNNSLSVGQYEYLAAGANIDDIVGASPRIQSANPSLEISGWERAGTAMRFDYRMTPVSGGDNLIDLPITYIPNYEVRVNGQKAALSRTLTAHVAFEPPFAEGTVTVRYKEPKLFRLSELVSALTLLVLLLRKPLAAALQRLPAKHRGTAR